MTTRRFPVGVLALIPIMIGLGVYAFTGQQPVAPPPGATATARPAAPATPPIPGTSADLTALAAAATPTAYGEGWRPTVTPPDRSDALATPFSPPVAVPPSNQPVKRHGAFHEGAWVRVNTGDGDCLNARRGPSMDPQYEVAINVCLRDGYEGYLEGMAYESDGHWWWTMAGAGYVAEDYLVYLRDVSLRVGRQVQLPAGGQIAFIREGAVWLMQADGSGQRVVVPAFGDKNDFNLYPQDLGWSPDGAKLSFNVTHSGDGAGLPPRTELHIVDVASGADRVIAGIGGRGWSPDGSRLGIVRGTEGQGMDIGWTGVPGWLDVATGKQHLIGTETFWEQDPPAFNFDGTLLLVTHAVFGDNVTPERSIRIWDLAGTEIERIAMPDAGFYSSPHWAPHDNRIAFHVSLGDRPSYAVYSLAEHRITTQASVPAADPNIGGRCGGADMWRSAWSGDGATLYYSYTSGKGGTNGVWAWDVATGTQRLIPAIDTGAPSAASGGAAGAAGLVAFSSGPDIFIGSVGGGMPVLITDGWYPVWSPVR